MKQEIDIALMLRIVTDVLHNDLATVQAKVPDDFDYSRVFLPKIKRLDDVHEMVNKAYDYIASDHQRTVNIQYWDERETYLTQALATPQTPEQQKVLQEELDKVMEKKRARFSEIASPKGPPNWAYEIRSLGYLMLRILRAKDRSDEVENELAHQIETLFRARLAETIRPEI
jgi:hypothetical protein